MSLTDASATQLLNRSVDQYTEILHFCDKLASMLETCDYVDVTQHAADLQEMQEKAYIDDEKLLVQIKKNPKAFQSNVQFVKRQEIIKKILEKYKRLIPGLKSVLAVARADRENLKISRSAVAGYSTSNSVKIGVSMTA